MRCSEVSYQEVYTNGEVTGLTGLTVNGRPLVAIDPEDREQVDRVWTVIAEAQDAVPYGAKDDEVIDATQAALRSLVASLKPTEPTGLGAVVEDARGRTWVRYLRSGTSAPWVWSEAPENAERLSIWSAIPAVRVLNEGVDR